MSEANKTATEIFMQLHDHVLNFDADSQAELFEENGIWELPFAPEPVPKVISGRESIRKFGRMGMERSKERGRRLLEYSNLKIHLTHDANIIIAEFDLKGEFIGIGKRYSIPFIQVVKVCNNKITHLRDYFVIEMMNSSSPNN